MQFQRKASNEGGNNSLNPGGVKKFFENKYSCTFSSCVHYFFFKLEHCDGCCQSRAVTTLCDLPKGAKFQISCPLSSRRRQHLKIVQK